MIEGTHLSEGRGTTRALEVVGASDLDFSKILKLMQKKAPQWLKGALIRECYFEPVFYKHEKKLCHGFQLHTDFKGYNPKVFKPYRLISLMLKCIKEIYPDYKIFREFIYEYVDDKLAFDVITGGTRLRQWIEDHDATAQDLEKQLKQEEAAWLKKSKKYWLY